MAAIAFSKAAKLSGVDQDNPDDNQRIAVNRLRRDDRPYLTDVPLIEKTLCATVARRRANRHLVRQVGVAKPPIGLKDTKHLDVDAIELRVHGRIFQVLSNGWRYRRSDWSFTKE